jgi:hypothetical protein
MKMKMMKKKKDELQLEERPMHEETHVAAKAETE